jgi:hypothetical protein
MIRMMTSEERIETGRAAFELERQFGRDAHIFAAKKANSALTAGDSERAQFWQWVEAALKSR